VHHYSAARGGEKEVDRERDRGYNCPIQPRFEATMRYIVIIVIVLVTHVVTGSILFCQTPLDESSLTMGKVTFEGNHSFSDKDLIKRMKSKSGQPFDRFGFEQDLQHIVTYYKDRGYLQAHIASSEEHLSPDGQKLEFVIHIDEGVPTIVHEVSVRGYRSVPRPEIMKAVQIKVGDPLDENKLAFTEYNIAAVCARYGYVYATVKTETKIGSLLHRAAVVFTVDEGKQVMVRSISISGNRDVRPAIIEREIVIEPGEIYNPEKAYESQRRIYATSLFRDVRFVALGIDAEEDSVDLIFKVVEGSPRWVAFGGGYQSTNEIWTNVEWGHDNLLDNGQRLSLRGDFSFDPFDVMNEYDQYYQIFYTEPYLFGKQLWGRLHPFHRRQRDKDTLIVRTGVDAGIGRYWRRHFQTFLKFTYEEVLWEASGGQQPESLSTINNLLLSASYDLRDNIFDPTSGSFSYLSMETAGGYLGGSSDFHRFILDTSTFTKPWKNLIIALRGRVGYILPYGRTEIVPLTERFELGGAHSIRGYDQDIITASDTAPENVMVEGSVELRFPLFWRFWGGYFVDTGSVWGEWDDVNTRALKVGAGFGLRYATLIGPLRLDYGRKITESTSEDRGRVYLAVGHNF
jgi:outer membrane protein insertion porin family